MSSEKPFTDPATAETIARLERRVGKLQAIVDCCAAECPPDESLEVNERVALLRERAEAAEAIMEPAEEAVVVMQGTARLCGLGPNSQLIRAADALNKVLLAVEAAREENDG